MIKHKRTLAPWRCDHCQEAYYGFGTSGSPIIPPEMHLCCDCHISGWERYLYHQHRNLYDRQKENIERIHEIARAWIADKTKNPLPKENPYHSSVPVWMRKAIDAGLVQCNGKEVYIVYSMKDGTPVKVKSNVGWK